MAKKKDCLFLGRDIFRMIKQEVKKMAAKQKKEEDYFLKKKSNAKFKTPPILV